jgi:5-carboxymethyl-2-hydroxymuconate isomerase
MEGRVDIAALCDTIRRAAIETGVFPLAGVRVRAMRADFVSIADGDPSHGYIDVSIRLREGRDPAVKQTAVQHIFDAAHAFLAPAMIRHSIALSMEMRDIDANLSPKSGTIRDHLKKEPSHD